jgi:hypothetical protein
MAAWIEQGWNQLARLLALQPPLLRRPLLTLLIPMHGRFVIPASHRRWLRCRQAAFVEQVQQRWPGESYRRLRLRNWPIQPFIDLLNRPAGGHAYCGGPLFADLSLLPALRHFRGDRCIDDPLQEPADASPKLRTRLRGRAFWCGPVCHHFGHQVADFGSRVLLASLEPQPGVLLWQRFGPGSDQPLKAWQSSLLRYLNPGGKRIHWIHEPVRVDELVVIPQQARMRAAPTLAHLAALTWLQRCLPAGDTAPLLYLSRSRFSPCRSADSLLGGYAAEREFEAILEGMGVQVLHPQELPLEQQLCLYRAASTIIVAEGSAQHGLELLGYNGSKRVLVICRRPQQPGMELPLQARFPHVRFLQAMREWWMAKGDVPWNGLALLDYRAVAAALAPLGLPLTTTDVTVLEEAAAQQLEELSARVELVRLQIT